MHVRNRGAPSSCASLDGAPLVRNMYVTYLGTYTFSELTLKIAKTHNKLNRNDDKEAIICHSCIPDVNW